MLSRLQELKPDMLKCNRCNFCKMAPFPTITDAKYEDICPIFKHFRMHGYTASGQSYASLAILDGRIEPDQEFADDLAACTACGACATMCMHHTEADRLEINMVLREHLVDEGFAPGVHKKAMANLEEHDNIYGDKLKNSPGAWAQGLNLKKLPAEKAEVLLFAGCSTRHNASYAASARKLAELLLAAGVDVGILGDDEPCCGLPAYWRGFRDLFVDKATGVKKTFDDLGVKKIVVLGGSCYGAIKARYHEYAEMPQAELLHATECLAQLIEEGKLKLPNAVNKVVTYHDPCYLGRRSELKEKWVGERKTAFGQMEYFDPPRKLNYGTTGVFDPPRTILKAIPGLEFKEMHRIREYSWCCGGGGGTREAAPEVEKTTALDRLDEARDVAAECIVTACPYCEQTFSTAKQKSEREDIRQLEVLDIVDLAYEAAGLKA
ncbi:(Fe-S)-binding protein [Christensenellaceae bacterium OttesenSCG-928-K19]|nr:(Fe-S)-binding protein [Christensenellaceae bacterium OttesenSCG-928-K19]